MSRYTQEPWHLPQVGVGERVIVDGLEVVGMEVPQPYGYGTCRAIRWTDRGIDVEAHLTGGVNGHYGSVSVIIGPDRIALRSDYTTRRDDALTPELESYILGVFAKVTAHLKESFERKQQQAEAAREAAKKARLERTASVSQLLAN